jgi:hypothetical protein
LWILRCGKIGHPLYHLKNEEAQLAVPTPGMGAQNPSLSANSNRPIFMSQVYLPVGKVFHLYKTKIKE